MSIIYHIYIFLIFIFVLLYFLYKKMRKVVERILVETKKIDLNDILETHILEKSKKPYPPHVAFIMDGNGRWAQRLNKERNYGHTMGAIHLAEIITDCFRHETKYLTFFVFAEQNWKRPKEEIDNIFDIIYKKIKILDMEIDYCNFRLLVQGRLDRIPKKLRRLLKKVQEKTKDKERAVIIAIDYSGRREIVRACDKLLKQKGTLTIESIQEKIQENLYVSSIPDPDLIIRTGGEKRVSDFLLWQLCNSEFYFTDVFWPDFDIVEFKKAIADYHKRQRRYGDIVL